MDEGQAETRKPWDRLEQESSFWYNRFERFRLMGPDRNLLAFYNQWRAQKGREGTRRNSPNAWREAAKLYQWRERAEAWDEVCRQEAAAVVEAEALAALSSGYALKHKRVILLNRLAELLGKEAEEPNRLWLDEPRMVGKGELAQLVNVIKFNGGLIAELRGLLADLASEMGDRVKKVEASGPGGAPLYGPDVISVYVYDDADPDTPNTDTQPAA